MAMTIGASWTNMTSQNQTNLITDYALVEEELRYLLSIPKNSLFFGNGIGLDLEKYLYLQDKQATFNLIKHEIEKLFRKYNKAFLKRVQMTFKDSALEIILTVSLDPAGQNTLNMPLVLNRE